ncbi:transposase [Chlorogloeopsis sp. ULAP02]|uniref:helix-turn-helix domain-containing protein n=1 Tax=Chlorogloeopsis sp. ULAP02 TaxID=3107926 RepID=UPI003136B75E
MKAYSLDLRQKILEIYKKEKISQRQLAKRFGVSKSFVQSLLRRYRKEGTVAKKPHGGGKPRLLTSTQIEQLRQLVTDNKDATLDELCELLYQKIQVKVSRSTMGRILQQMNLKRKKKPSTPVNTTLGVGIEILV